MSGYTNRKAPRPTRFTFVGHRFDPRRTRATFYYRDSLGHHYAEKINFDSLEDTRVDRKLLARALDFALFARGLDYFAIYPADRVTSKKSVSPLLAELLAANDPAVQFIPSDPRPSLPYQGSGNLVLMDPVDTSLELTAELTAAHLPFRLLCIATDLESVPVLAGLHKPFAYICRSQPVQPLTDIALALIQAILYNFNRLYLSYPADDQLADFIYREISPDLELIWKN